MEKPILYYWAPCPTCSVLTHFADEHGIVAANLFDGSFKNHQKTSFFHIV